MFDVFCPLPVWLLSRSVEGSHIDNNTTALTISMTKTTGIVILGSLAVFLGLVSDSTGTLKACLTPSIWHALIFMIATYFSLDYYNKVMESVKRVEMDYLKVVSSGKTYNLDVENTNVNEVPCPKRRSIIKLVDNRKSFDLSKWKDKKYLVVNSRFNSNNTENIKKRINSWHGDSNELYTSTNLRKRNVSMLIPSPSLIELGDETFDSISTDIRSSLFSTNSSIDNENDRGSSKSADDFDCSLIDMSYNMGIETESSRMENTNTSKITTYLYDIIRKKSINKSNESVSSINLKPFNLRKPETS